MSEISTKEMLEALEVAFHRYPIYTAEYKAIRAALLERDELQAEADRQRDIAIGFGERIKMLEKERDALKAKVEEQDKELELLGAGQRKFKARAEKAEAEANEWRDKAMFQQGRADEAVRIAGGAK